MTAGISEAQKLQQEKLYRYYTEPKMVTELTRRTMVLVLAGGEGSRLKNLTAWRAKPAVPFGGKYRIIDFALSNCVNSGLRRIGVLTQYKSHSLIRHLQRAWSFMRAEIGEFVEILPAQQRTEKKEWYQGTADALYQNLDILRRHNPQYVIVLGGDHIYTMDYSAMLLRHVESRADFTVGCIEVPREEATEFGVMSVDEDMRIIKSLKNRPTRRRCRTNRMWRWLRWVFMCFPRNSCLPFLSRTLNYVVLRMTLAVTSFRRIFIPRKPWRILSAMKPAHPVIGVM